MAHGLADVAGLRPIALSVGEHPSQGGDRVAVGTGRIGILTSQHGVKLDVVEGSGAALEVGEHEITRLVLNGCGLDLAFHEGLVEVTDRAGRVLDHASHTLVPLAANPHGPFHRFSFTHLALPGG